MNDNRGIGLGGCSFQSLPLGESKGVAVAKVCRNIPTRRPFGSLFVRPQRNLARSDFKSCSTAPKHVTAMTRLIVFEFDPAFELRSLERDLLWGG